MAARARELGRADAAEAIVADCLHLVEVQQTPRSEG
jgi:hypothetical protein